MTDTPMTVGEWKIEMFKKLFHSLAHLLQWNEVIPGVYEYNFERFVGVKCNGCGLVRKITGNQWVEGKTVCFSSSHHSHYNPIIDCKEKGK